MKNKIFIAFCIAALCCSCERKTLGDASLIEGAWELTTEQCDKTVFADDVGTHLKDSAMTRTYESKELVWLFQEKNISWWEYVEQDGEGFWDFYLCDCSRNYVVEGEGKDMQIIETTGSIIPGMEDLKTVTNYKVEKLTSKEMTISCIDNMYISDTQTTVEVHVTYTFKRENTLVDYLKLNPEYPKIFED